MSLLVNAAENDEAPPDEYYQEIALAKAYEKLAAKA